MSGTDLGNESVLRGVAKLLGLPDAAALADVKPSGLWRLTHRDLLDIARTLGLSKVSRLKKEALLARIWDVLAAQVGADTGVGHAMQAMEVGNVGRDAGGDSDTRVSGGGEVNGSSHAAISHVTVDRPNAVSPSAARDSNGAAKHARGSDVGSPTPPSPEEMRQSRPGAAHKFEVGEGAEVDLGVLRAEAEARIPWSYGRDRITAMAIDSDRLYAYWEVSDDAIARARSELGAGGDSAYVCLRVYDITGRIFDGTNAHAYFDHGTDRTTRQWFFQIGKPTSEAVIDVGLKSHEGYFVKVARSGRVSFPRRESAFGGEPEWLTVRVSTGDIEGHGHGPGGPGGGGSDGTSQGGQGEQTGHGGPGALPYNPMFSGHGAQGGQLGQTRRFMWGGRIAGDGDPYPTEYFRWEEVATIDLEGDVSHSWTWQGDVEMDSWSAGPFSFPVESPQAVQQVFGGTARVFRSGPRTHVVWGPWQIVIKGLGAHAEREVLGTWEIFRSWSAAGLPGGSLGPADLIASAPLGSAVRMGASDLRLGGASERFRIGASELRLGGASERQFVGASELRFAGASERSWKGSSELLFAGGSERRLGGASELRLGGASERQLGGGSELRLGGASEGHLGGGSEARLAAGNGSYPTPPAPAPQTAPQTSSSSAYPVVMVKTASK